MSSDSVHHVVESAPYKWRYEKLLSRFVRSYLTYLRRPGEELVAVGFIAIVFYLFVDMNFGIYRMFKKKQGLYYWCMLLGTWGCVIDPIGLLVKDYASNPKPVWPLYTLFILGGWTVYAPAQLLVLYSRLHMVNNNDTLQRCVLIMIIAVASLIIIPTWVLVWPAYNPYNSQLSDIYSVKEAIVDRCTQIGYTVTECIINGIYIWSIAQLLKLKPSVRQRRVMLDLICVNVITVCLDILTVVLVFLNLTGISHPIQTFSYIIKLKLEYMVLNQLMALAVRGIRKEEFAERRYYHPSTPGEKESSTASSKTSRWRLESYEPVNTDSAKDLLVLAPTLSKFQATPYGSAPQTLHDQTDGGRWLMKAKVMQHGTLGAGENAEEDEDEEIGVHMWETRGKLVMEVPWFKKDGHV